MKSKSKDDNMAYCNKHERDYPMTLGCPQCKEELEQNHFIMFSAQNGTILPSLIL